MRRIGIAFAAVLAMILGFAAPASAQLRVDVTQGNVQPMPIAIPNFAAPQPSDAAAGQNIAPGYGDIASRAGAERICVDSAAGG